MSSFEALLGALARSPELPIDPPSDVLAAGHMVGRYRVIELLGKGGMGAVYRAHDETLGRDVALKVLLVGSATSPVDRFRREVVALASVSHENVVTVHDAGLDGALPYIILDLVEGRTLRERLTEGSLPAVDALRLARDLARGLGAAHAVGIVHRDLKPENVLVNASGTAKLVDFGLARLLAREGAPELGATEAGTFLGTAHYMAPEQVRGESVDARADIFALGAVVYEALTGRRAFEAPSRAEVISAVLRDDPAPHAPVDEMARRVLAVSLRCLAKAPRQRYQSTAEILDALERDPPPEIGRPPLAIPETRYASTSGVHIAYQVVSPSGHPTLLAGPVFISNIEVIWESPPERAWIESLASFTHYLHYDRRGVGMSDPIDPECTIDERVEDLRAVLDAEKVDRSFFLGVSEGGPIAIAFAAKYPERTRGLVLMNSFARIVSGDGYPHGVPVDAYQPFVDKWVERWGTPKTLTFNLFLASRPRDEELVRWGNRYERQCVSPGTLRRLLRQQFAIDVRGLLSSVACPTLVLHRRDDPAVAVEHGRYLAEHIPGARYVELDGVDHAPSQGDTATPLALIRAFVDDS